MKSLLWRYVHDKIRGANEDQHPTADVLSGWLFGLPEMMPDLTDTEMRTDNPAHELIGCIEYTVFGGKQELMRQFEAKVGRLEQAIGRLAPGGGSEPTACCAANASAHKSCPERQMRILAV